MNRLKYLGKKSLNSIEMLERKTIDYWQAVKLWKLIIIRPKSIDKKPFKSNRRLENKTEKFVNNTQFLLARTFSFTFWLLFQFSNFYSWNNTSRLKSSCLLQLGIRIHFDLSARPSSNCVGLFFSNFTTTINNDGCQKLILISEGQVLLYWASHSFHHIMVAPLTMEDISYG